MSIGGIMLIVLAGVLGLNAISYAIISHSKLFLRDVEIVTIQVGKNKRKAIYLVGGCQCRGARTFNFMLNGLPKDATVYLIEYRNSGFNVNKAAKKLSEHIHTRMYSGVTFVAVSLGYQLAARVAKDTDKIIALNPCIGKVSLAPKLRKAVNFLPIGYLTVFLIGWISYLPLVKIGSRPSYSLQLLMDQFSICANNKTLDKYKFQPEVLILSTKDTVVHNVSLVRNLTNEPTALYWLNTEHFGVIDNLMMYKKPVLQNLS